MGRLITTNTWKKIISRDHFCGNLRFNGEWRGRQYATKPVEAYAVDEDGWLVITVIVRFF
jgi:hypothetical protein